MAVTIVPKIRIDLGLFLAQRELLAKIVARARQKAAYLPEPGDEDLLEGLLNLADELADLSEPPDGDDRPSAGFGRGSPTPA
jgi:hypothetical protein